MRGKLIVNPKGFGFARIPDEEESVFVPPGNFAGALDGDTVDLHTWPGDRGTEGRVVAVIERRRTRLVGVLRRMGRRRWTLAPDDSRVLGTVEVAGGPNGAHEGEVVAASITTYPTAEDDTLVVAIDRPLGPPGARETEVLRILVEHDIDPEFPADVLADAEDTPASVLEADLERRADLRGLPFMTIDPPDARDFDDAVCVEAGDTEVDPVRLHVAVADVSHYVRVGTPIDREARVRCFSTYLPDRAIPMLPPQLSSAICSLVPGEDRCAMVVSMSVDVGGEVRDVQVRAAVIHSQRRLTYADAARVLGEQRSRQPGEVQDRIQSLRACADRLRAHRMRRGAIELALDEAKILLDEDDPERVRGVEKGRSTREMTRAYNLIEELMLAANEAVGAIAVEHDLPVVFRAHESPDPDKLQRLAAAAETVGVRVEADRMSNPRGMQKFLGRVATHERADPLNVLALRAMKQADYRAEHEGHFALASEAYVHFTSPIRRYPDLISHRVLKAWLRRRGGDCGPDPVPRMPKNDDRREMASRSSERERTCAKAENETKALFVALYMRDRIGDRFEGRIRGFAPSGMWVQLEDPFIDGHVRMADLEKELGETFEADEPGIQFIGLRTGRVLTLGDRVTVEVSDSSPARRRVELYPIKVW